MDIVSPGDSALAVVANIDGQARHVSISGNEIGLCAARQIATLVEDVNMNGYADLYTISRDGNQRNQFHANGDISLVLSDATEVRKPTEHPTCHAKKLQQTCIVSVALRGRGVVGADVRLVDREANTVLRRTVGTQVLTGSRGPDSVNLAVREPGDHTLGVRFADAAVKEEKITVGEGKHVMLTWSFASRMLHALMTASVLAVCTAEGAGVVDTSKSQHARLRSVDMDDVRWTAGFWADKNAICRGAIVPAVRQALLDPKNSEQLVNLRVAAGLEEGPFRGTDWSDGDCYKWLESLSLAYEVTKDPALDRMLDKWIGVIAEAQREDGFISMNAQLPKKNVQPLDVPYTHQLYNMGHMLTAACIHHRATGKNSFLSIARKTADFLHAQFSPRPPRLVHFPWNPSAHMGLVELYRTTGDRRYLETAKIMIDNRGSSPGGGSHRNGGTDQTQDRVPLRGEAHAVGHAVCAMYLYCGASDLYVETGEAPLLTALDRIWRNVTTRQMYLTGAVGAGHGRSFRGDPVHEAFMGDYVLPERAYAETCSNIGNAMWNYRMLTATGEGRFADVMERVLYNSLLSAVSIDGKSFFYCNPLVWDGTPGKGHHTGRRWTTECNCYCCPPSVARTIAKLQNWSYSVSAEGVWVNLYGGSKLLTNGLPDGSTIGLTQQTDYPWGGQIKITVDQAPEKPIGMMLRIPGWVEGATAKLNGRPLDRPLEPGTYAAVRRTWKRGDVIELDLPMPVRLIEANPKVKGLENKVAVMRGPLVYCFEAPLEQGGEQVWRDGVFLPENIALTARHDPKLLGGVTVLEGTALAFRGRDRFVQKAASRAKPLERRTDWEDTLYRSFRPRGLEPAKEGTVPITLIPYYAWANRGLSCMEVWIPLAR